MSFSRVRWPSRCSILHVWSHKALVCTLFHVSTAWMKRSTQQSQGLDGLNTDVVYMWFDHDKSDVMVTPRYFWLLTLGMVSSYIVVVENWWGPAYSVSDMTEHLLTLNSMSHPFDHSCSVFKLRWNSRWSSWLVIILNNMLSSANNLISEERDSVMSLMYIRNSKGPSTVPWWYSWIYWRRLWHCAIYSHWLGSVI